MADDKYWMRRAIKLAEKGLGSTSPNPMVGAVIVQSGEEIASGWHRKCGHLHAEIEALNLISGNAEGATLYVTLEPCCTYGKTPPCVDAIVNAGIRRVVVASVDPNPIHAGQGIKALRKHGLEVVVGVGEKGAQLLNETFFCWIRYQRPYVLLKLAITVDGKIATKNGESKWITCSKSRQKVQKLRRWADAILVGAETIRQDNPQLIVKNLGKFGNQPLRIIASRSGNLGKNPKVKTDNLSETRVVSFDTKEEWQNYFKSLGKEGICSILIEGGGEIAGMFIQDNLVDKVVIFIAPKLLGGRDSRSALAGKNPSFLHESKSLTDIKISRSGSDFLLTGYLTDVHRMY